MAGHRRNKKVSVDNWLKRTARKLIGKTKAEPLTTYVGCVRMKDDIHGKGERRHARWIYW